MVQTVAKSNMRRRRNDAMCHVEKVIHSSVKCVFVAGGCFNLQHRVRKPCGIIADALWTHLACRAALRTGHLGADNLSKELMLSIPI